MADLFGNELPEPAPKRRKASAAPKEKKLTDKQRRLLAPAPKDFAKVEDAETRAINALIESGLLAKSETPKLQRLLDEHVPDPVAVEMAEWKRRNGR